MLIFDNFWSLSFSTVYLSELFFFFFFKISLFYNNSRKYDYVIFLQPKSRKKCRKDFENRFTNKKKCQKSFLNRWPFCKGSNPDSLKIEQKFEEYMYKNFGFSYKYVIHFCSIFWFHAY